MTDACGAAPCVFPRIPRTWVTHFSQPIEHPCTKHGKFSLGVEAIYVQESCRDMTGRWCTSDCRIQSAPNHAAMGSRRSALFNTPAKTTGRAVPLRHSHKQQLCCQRQDRWRLDDSLGLRISTARASVHVPPPLRRPWSHSCLHSLTLPAQCFAGEISL